MILIDKVLNRLDAALKDRKDSELFIIYSGIFLITAFVVYLYVYPLSNKKLDSSKRELQTVKAKIASEKNYINSKSVGGDKLYYIKKAQAKLKREKQKLASAIFVNGYIDSKLRELSYLLYNDVNWADFIDNIAKIAKRYNIRVNFIKNQFNKLNYKKVEQALDIEVDVNGDFHNLIKFINSIEENRLIVDIYSLKMNIEKTLHLNLKIAVWGIRY